MAPGITHYTPFAREELYELVWSKPLTSVAGDFGVSSVAIKKVCRRQQVPRHRRPSGEGEVALAFIEDILDTLGAT